jgi:hypothetical protein
MVVSYFESDARGEDVQYQATHGGRRIELLRHSRKMDLVPVKNLHELGKIEQRAAEASTR